MTTAMDMVRASREPDRLKAMDYIKAICMDFMELHGDRLFGEDPAIICGIGKIQNRSVMVIGQQKSVNFGMVITFVDTPGASCGIEAEERGQASAIANCIMEFSKLKTPTLSVIIGEGGSGGALAISVTDEIWMLEKSVYSILSPEGFASILWKNASKKEEAAQLMGLTSQHLMDDEFIDKIIPEDGSEIYRLKEEIIWFLEKNQSISMEKLLKKRYYKYRKII